MDSVVFTVRLARVIALATASTARTSRRVSPDEAGEPEVTLVMIGSREGGRGDSAGLVP